VRYLREQGHDATWLRELNPRVRADNDEAGA
jgi:hypothetical protein